MPRTTCSGTSVSRKLRPPWTEDQTLGGRRIVAGKSQGWFRFSMLSAVRDVPIVRPHVPTCQATKARIHSPTGELPEFYSPPPTQPRNIDPTDTPRRPHLREHRVEDR